jgi:hypothetical protein
MGVCRVLMMWLQSNMVAWAKLKTQVVAEAEPGPWLGGYGRLWFRRRAVRVTPSTMRVAAVVHQGYFGGRRATVPHQVNMIDVGLRLCSMGRASAEKATLQMSVPPIVWRDGTGAARCGYKICFGG